MTTQAAPDFNAELERQATATRTAQALANQLQARVDEQRKEIEWLQMLHEPCQQSITYWERQSNTQRETIERLTAELSDLRASYAILRRRSWLRRVIGL